nr:MULTISPECIES: YggS family pyridoxal phosphate-dependent enzyme [unclassified Halanaerobium]
MEKEDLISRLNKVKKEIKESAEKAGRKYEEINLIAVSKNHPVESIKVLKNTGVKLFGENRVQELEEKDNKLKKINIEIDWHFIGHLQRNKVKYLMRMPNCKMIESLDSWRLAKEIDKRAKKNNRNIPLLIEVNIAEDENKYGIKPNKVETFLKKVIKLDNIEIKGLMTIAPYNENPEEARPYFRKMKKIQQDLNDRVYPLPELSMGMSNDYKIAVEEGATAVRIGTAIFGKRNY